jgi:chemotaxis protein MotB
MIRKKNNASGGPAPWIVTYSDLMSLLLTFFILLYSMSTIDAEKFKNITEQLQLALTGEGRESIFDGGTEQIESPLDEEIFADDEMPVDGLREDEAGEILPEELQEMFERISSYIRDQGLSADVRVLMDRSGIYVEIQDAILFDMGSADLKPSGLEVIGKLEGIVNEFENELVVEGHTDDIPINTREFPSNWELSTGRALSVLRYLEEEHGIAPARLSARGYGEHAPLVPNSSRENRAMNRRVNLLIVFEGDSENHGEN